LDSTSEFEEDDGYLLAWEFLGEEFEWKAHSLGAHIQEIITV